MSSIFDKFFYFFSYFFHLLSFDAKKEELFTHYRHYYHLLDANDIRNQDFHIVHSKVLLHTTDILHNHIRYIHNRYMPYIFNSKLQLKSMITSLFSFLSAPMHFL